MRIVPMKKYMIERVSGILLMTLGDGVGVGVDNSLLSHTDNCRMFSYFYPMKETHLVLMEAPDNKFSISLSKAKTKFCSSLHYNGDNSYLFVNRAKSISSEQIWKMSTIQINFV